MNDKFPDDLLELAQHLATWERRPRQASLRRSVSTAYYALFHLLTIETAKNWRRLTERPRIARMIEHNRVKQACTEQMKQIGTSPQHGSTPFHLLTIASSFVQLQDHRHTADYDHSVTWHQTDVLQKIGMARGAFVSWRTIRDSPEAQGFVASLLVTRR